MLNTENVDHTFQMRNQTKINDARVNQNWRKKQEKKKCRRTRRTNPWKSHSTIRI